MANRLNGQGAPQLLEATAKTAPARLNVWLVDDDTDMIGLFSKLISRDPGLKCSKWFTSAPLLLDALQRLAPPDVILLDVHMPEMTGIQALPHIKRLAPVTPVVILSAFSDLKCRQAALAGGARSYHQKTKPLKQLLAAIRGAQASPPPAAISTAPSLKCTTPLDADKRCATRRLRF